MSALEPGLPSEGRIRRQILGRSHRFALVFPPGLEEAGRLEAATLGLAELPGQEGAWEWEGRIPDLYRALLFLRIPSRIFLRLGQFRAGAREELFRNIHDIPWELWLTPGPLRVDAHLERCRISHEGQAAQTVEAAIRRRWKDSGLDGDQGLAVGALMGPEKNPRSAQLDDDEIPAGTTTAASLPQRLVLRMEDNKGSLSLDCGGLGLYHRGWRDAQGAAPLRENLAAGVLKVMGWPQAGVLVDGMCGSGTFALEGLAMSRGASAFHPGRRFACMDWPCVQAENFAWQRRQIVGPANPGLILGLDWHQGVLDKARENALRLQDGWARVDSMDESQLELDLRQGDFFALEPANLEVQAGAARFLILNPPYGLRLDDGEGNLYPRLWDHLPRVWSDWTVGVLAPEGRDPPGGSGFALATRIRHGGLRIRLWLRKPKAPG